MESFADLIAPVTPERFLADHYGKAPLHIPAADARRRATLDWTSLNEILSVSSHWTEPRLKLFIEGRRIAPEHYCDTVQTLDGEMRRVNPGKVRVFLSMGASLVANATETLTPGMRRVARLLEREFLGLTSANIYCSFGGRRAFNSHYDSHEVFALHVEGEKVWRLYEGRADNPVGPPPERPDMQQILDRQKGRLMAEVTMRPGDLLYIPRGWFHDALASSEASLHVTYSVEPRNGRMLFRLLEQEAMNDSLFRDYLPRGDLDGGAALARRLGELGERLQAILADPAFRQEVAEVQRGVFGELSEYGLPAVGALEAWDVLPRRTELARGAEGWELRTERGPIPVGSLHKAASWILTRPAFTTQELAAWFPQADEAALRALVERLAQGGMIARRG